MQKILNFGSLNIDRVYSVEHFVRPGETLLTGSYAQHAGGKGLNQSIALARAGAQVTHAGKIGGDGDFLKQLLQTEGVDITRLLEDQAAVSGHAIIQVSAAGENAILIEGGTNRTITADERRAMLADSGEGDTLLLQNEINNVPDIIRQGAAQGMQVVVSPAPFTADVHEWPLDLVQTVILNEIEGEELTGQGEPRAICESLAARGVRRVILTLGSRGVVSFENGEFLEQPAEKVTPVDTTAAGDCFTGYWLASIIQGLDNASALRRATRAAAICVTRQGAAPSIPLAAEVG